ncbi:hypothetical protein T492DRAFT_904867, partial [Pavlovales sp. CCMP2436]
MADLSTRGNVRDAADAAAILAPLDTPTAFRISTPEEPLLLALAHEMASITRVAGWQAIASARARDEEEMEKDASRKIRDLPGEQRADRVRLKQNLSTAMGRARAIVEQQDDHAPSPATPSAPPARPEAGGGRKSLSDETLDALQAITQATSERGARALRKLVSRSLEGAGAAILDKAVGEHEASLADAESKLLRAATTMSACREREKLVDAPRQRCIQTLELARVQHTQASEDRARVDASVVADVAAGWSDHMLQGLEAEQAPVRKEVEEDIAKLKAHAKVAWDAVSAATAGGRRSGKDMLEQKKQQERGKALDAQLLELGALLEPALKLGAKIELVKVARAAKAQVLASKTLQSKAEAEREKLAAKAEAELNAQFPLLPLFEKRHNVVSARMAETDARNRVVEAAKSLALANKEHNEARKAIGRVMKVYTSALDDLRKAENEISRLFQNAQAET